MVIISSFYNEEYLLPWWLRHHKEYFEHGVLFNYFSTDRSLEIIEEICPTWEVRNTRNKDWDFKDNDEEYMEAEREFGGYKMVLTTTEFLVGKLPKLTDKETCYGLKFLRIIDDNPKKEPTYNSPLVEQKKRVYKEPRDKHKRRFLHNYPDGQYYVGRHSTRLPVKDIDAVIYKYVYAPWNEKFINRKLSMKTHMSENDIITGKGEHHTWEREKLENEYRTKLKTTRD